MLVSDLGKVSIESVSAKKFWNYQLVSGRDNTFKPEAKIKRDHTYAIFIFNYDSISWVAVRVDAIEESGIRGRYAVLNYQQIKLLQLSQGFDWMKENR